MPASLSIAMMELTVSMRAYYRSSVHPSRKKESKKRIRSNNNKLTKRRRRRMKGRVRKANDLNVNS